MATATATSIALAWPGDAATTPWPLTQQSREPKQHCESYFGNGFTDTFDLVPYVDTGDSSSKQQFRCHYNRELPATWCELSNMIVDPDHVTMSRGGEPLESVTNRPDEQEFPQFRPGGFSIAVQSGGTVLSVDETQLGKFKSINKEWVKSFSAVDASARDRCQNRVSKPTLFLVRYEYANLFHTSTDWYNVYAIARAAGLGRDVNVVFVDGHCQSPMDEAWNTMFPDGAVSYLKHMSGTTCYDHAIIVPTGYQAAISTGLTPTQDCAANSRVREFGDMMLSVFGIQPLRHASEFCNRQNFPVTFVRRGNYKAHPRHSGRIERRMENEQAVFDAFKEWAQSENRAHIELREGNFADMTMKEQLEMVHSSCMVVGAHGAGMTHVLFSPPGTKVVEVRTPGFRRHHFMAFSGWAGHEYVKMDVSSTRPDPKSVLQSAQRLMETTVPLPH